MRVRQLRGLDIAQSRIIPDKPREKKDGEGADDEAKTKRHDAETKRRLRRSEELRDLVFREAREAAGDVLVVAQKAVIAQWTAAGTAPRNVSFAWFNAIAGRDDWGPSADGLPARHRENHHRRPHAAEGDGRGTGGRSHVRMAVEPCKDGRYERHEAVIRMRDGRAVPTETDRHPDPIAEAFRWLACEGQLLQAIGRARAVNRTSVNPVEVLILTDRPLPIPVDELVSWDEIAPRPADRMLGTAGVALESSNDIAAAFDLWPSGLAVRLAKMKGRRKCVSISMKRKSSQWGWKRTFPNSACSASAACVPSATGRPVRGRTWRGASSIPC